MRAQGISLHGDNFDLTKAMAEAWRDLGDEGRKPYYELYDTEKARYNREMEAYVAPGSLLPPVTPSAAAAGSNINPASSATPVPDDAAIARTSMDAIQDEDENDNEDAPLVSQTDDAAGVQDEDEDEEMEDVSFGGGFTAVNRR